MNFYKSTNFNINYAAQIIYIDKFESHPNPKVERMKVAHVLGCKVLVGIDYEPGYYLYFPPGSQINPTFLSKNNLFRHKEFNIDKEKSGYFEDSGRVKMLNLQKFISEGIVLPLETINIWKNINEDLNKEAIFDTIDEEWICKKYIVKPHYSSKSKTPKTKKVKVSKVIEDQFRFHYDTPQLKRNPFVITPNSLIHISFKEHGTSGISSYVLCKKELKWYDKLFKLIGLPIPTTDYDYLWSSRKVVKNPYYNESVTEGYYNCDIWALAHEIIKPHLTKGLTIYYEIVGYLPTGAPIQSLNGQPYDYGCTPYSGDEVYTYGKHFNISIYRITYTNIEGEVFEFSARQVHNWCRKHNLHPVKECYYGFAKDLYSELSENNFAESFIDKLSQDKNFYMEENSPNCHNKVPHEGVVIRFEDDDMAYKLKCLKFLDKELKDQDLGNTNIEDNWQQ